MFEEADLFCCVFICVDHTCTFLVSQTVESLREAAWSKTNKFAVCVATTDVPLLLAAIANTKSFIIFIYSFVLLRKTIFTYKSTTADNFCLAIWKLRLFQIRSLNFTHFCSVRFACAQTLMACRERWLIKPGTKRQQHGAFVDRWERHNYIRLRKTNRL